MAIGNFQEKPSAVGTSRRKGNLYKKASELAALCGARVAIVTISKKGKLSMFPNSEAVIQRYLSGKKRSSKSNSSSAEGLKNLHKRESERRGKEQAVEAAAAEMTEARDQILNVGAEEGFDATSVVDLNLGPHKQID